jgi:DNA mismatch repair protein MutS2
VDAHALQVLEYPEIILRLAGEARTELGQVRAEALAPSADVREIEQRQRRTTEGVALLDAAAEPDLAGVADVRDACARASRGGVLGPAVLRQVMSAIAVTLAARKQLEAESARAPSLEALLDPVDPGLAVVADAIARCVADEGDELRDDASPRLRSLRAELRRGAHRVREELERLARGAGLREHLQEGFVTERGGRPVLAVKASARAKVPGVVHDASSSGQTLFVEPFEVVELSNRLSETAGAEREEVERILAELSALVGEQAEALQALVGAAAELDLVLACATLSRRWRGAEVVIGDAVRLLGARHPLLDPAAAVPIDLDLGLVRALVVSGPNTGGKTVALKTLGLAALLHQAGLRPPVVEAELPVFDAVLADIGDEQSIEMSLSTFAGHIGRVVEILGVATERSLVLLDELASGTDPVEGSALAQAIVARLAGQARLTAVTTHYAELKEWASGTPDALNAATAFDPETQAPLFSVALGRPGTSHALRIAERLGLEAAVVTDARSRVAPERLRVAELLAEAEDAERETQAARAEAEEERDEARVALVRLRQREAELLEEIDRVRASAARERDLAVAAVGRELAEARAELRALRDEIRVARRRERERRRSTAQESAGAAERDRDRRLGAAAERSAAAERALRAVEPPAAQGPLAVGDPVEAASLGVVGTIAALDGDEAEVLGRGGLRVRVALARLRPRGRLEEGEEATPLEPPVRVHAAARGDVPDELDVRGHRAQEAREAVRRLVDDAALAGLATVRVVHGRGTGAVRTAVRDELTRHPLVERHESDSADGATVVQLASSS